MQDVASDLPRPVRDTVVIGASVGGIDALRTIIGALPSSFPAVVLIVLHIGAHRSVLASILRGGSALPVAEASDGEVARIGRVYVAPPDRHMLLECDRIRLSAGPRENYTRPAIDPLFRSAALARGARVVGVLLTGRLDDGVAGLQAIKECGGVAVVQDPASAEAPEMPRSALRVVAVDRVAPVDEIAGVLAGLCATPRPAARPAGDAVTSASASAEAVAAVAVPAWLAREHAVAMGEGSVIDELDAVGHRSAYACPDCGAALWQIDDPAPVRFRCHTGHAYSLRSLLTAHSAETERALWAALRALKEKTMLIRQMAALEERTVAPLAAGVTANHADALEAQTDTLRRFIESMRFTPSRADDPGV